jgi:hypothetical protein
MQTSTPLHPESTAVQSYLTALQAVITRMATNSSNCKTLCVTLVAAILVVVADKGKTSFTFVALLPVLLLCFLDAYYLGLEQGFRHTYNAFVAKLRDGNATVADLYIIVAKNKVNSKDNFDPGYSWRFSIVCCLAILRNPHRNSSAWICFRLPALTITSGRLYANEPAAKCPEFVRQVAAVESQQVDVELTEPLLDRVELREDEDKLND